MQGRPVVAVRSDEQQVEDGVPRVDLNLVVVAGVAVRVEEDLEVIVLEYDGIALGQRGSDVRLLKLRRDVEIPFVPQHAHACPITGFGAGASSDVNKPLGWLGHAPDRLVQPAVDLDPFIRVAANVSFRM